MLLHFYLRFSTEFGQTIFVTGNANELGNDDLSEAFPLQYLNDQLWHASVNVETTDDTVPVTYKYIVRNDKGTEMVEFGDDRIIEPEKIKSRDIVLIDTWNYTGTVENTFFTSAFQDVLLRSKKLKTVESTPVKNIKTYSHEFRVKAPLLKENEVLCIGGSATALKNWDTENPLLLTRNGNWWTTRVKLSKESFPITYKYGSYDRKHKKFLKFEEGNNRMLLADATGKRFTIVHDGFADLQKPGWKGAGVAIPVFSLRSKKSFGTGEFNDLKLLVDWAEGTGIRMIQLLPVNDTTATHTEKDSYPYSAISAFALHPLFLNLEEVAGLAHAHIIKPLAKKKSHLNSLPDVDYEQVMQFKISAIKELYQLQKDTIKDNFEYFKFFELNRHWLVPYAAFSYLRDKYGTAEFSEWKSNPVYNENAIQRLVSPSQKHYDDIALHYFSQYHLHLQLKAATGYAHKKGIVIKGDIPIGICRSSVDAWMEPSLYHMDQQAGAPPDDFSVKGQNWGFPTYNWSKMQEDHFTWWRKRFEQMSNYFDAFRIDHILGFFRIWSIPADEVEGIMGRFVPAIPVSINEFFEKRISFDVHRYTKPYYNDAILEQLFGDELASVKETFLDEDGLKEAFNTQGKVAHYFASHPEHCAKAKQGLFDLISNVILFEEKDSSGQKFHFRISMEESSSFQNLDEHSKRQLKELYINYFYYRQEELWKKEAMNKLPGLKRNTNMLVCGEDLGMVPHCVPEVMEQLGILSLEIQRMPKKTGTEFFHPSDAPYLSVVSPSTHDMSTIRGWWQEDAAKTQRFYTKLMGHADKAPAQCEPWINKEIVLQHFYSPAMWSIFQLQDLLGMSAEMRREDPNEERINQPSDPNHLWNYRMHINLEDLLKENAFNGEIKGYVDASGR
ncbi:MAG TPA: 4-alpha-glucanotransferase [Ferruginibacter sp.]|nr:4-alpha-glucanotransferase [Ferruginibacter sp.]